MSSSSERGAQEVEVTDLLICPVRVPAAPREEGSLVKRSSRCSGSLRSGGRPGGVPMTSLQCGLTERLGPDQRAQVPLLSVTLLTPGPLTGLCSRCSPWRWLGNSSHAQRFSLLAQQRQQLKMRLAFFSVLGW